MECYNLTEEQGEEGDEMSRVDAQKGSHFCDDEQSRWFYVYNVTVAEAEMIYVLKSFVLNPLFKVMAFHNHLH